MKCKRNIQNFNYNWDVAKFGNANVNLQRIQNEIAFEIHWIKTEGTFLTPMKKVLH